MKSKKLLYIQELAFNLPDDFDGEIEEALELLIKTKRESKNHEVDTEDMKNTGDCIKYLWENKDKKCCMYRCFCEYNQETDEWTYK